MKTALCNALLVAFAFVVSNCFSPPGNQTPDLRGTSLTFCGDGKCEAGETSSTCCIDCGCTGGQLCQINTCTSAPPTTMCGNGRCEAGETQTNCCRDCGCPSPQVCESNTCEYASASSQSWTVTNDCDIGTVDLRLFDVTGGIIGAVWPSTTTSYPIEPGATNTIPLTCGTGATICYGAAIGGDTWGVGLSGTGTCTNCCAVCGQQPAADIGQLTCP